MGEVEHLRRNILAAIERFPKAEADLQERLGNELAEERAFYELDSDGFVITKDTGPAGFYPGEPQDCEGGE